MGKRKYLYLGSLAFCIYKYLAISSFSSNYNFTWPLPSENKIGLLVYGEVSPADFTFVKEVVESVYKVKTETVVRNPQELQAVYDPSRQQYNIDHLLDQLEKDLPSQYFRGLVVLDKDIFGDGTNYVFGTGDNPGRLAVLTVKGYGLRVGQYRLEKNIFKKILRSLVLHELGHTLGLFHCENK